MPFAKQERANSDRDSDGDTSIVGLGPQSDDLHFRLEGKGPKVVSARELMDAVEEFFASIRIEDVLLDFRDRPRARRRSAEK